MWRFCQPREGPAQKATSIPGTTYCAEGWHQARRRCFGASTLVLLHVRLALSMWCAFVTARARVSPVSKQHTTRLRCERDTADAGVRGGVDVLPAWQSHVRSRDVQGVVHHKPIAERPAHDTLRRALELVRGKTRWGVRESWHTDRPRVHWMNPRVRRAICCIAPHRIDSLSVTMEGGGLGIMQWHASV